ncbi:hypothetical protein SAMN05661080_04297 [Modestobacter sp. DSM 44400]|uniref:hypothetical protein n=1 Tax=Modestobacter sp. DSM 44400 TaxID=1550230 RepID=UPI0008941ECB|nr:hypothetical protein [Modestobacter sp. DSM 44400]SDY69133.1 hypothetical protein SAMN05661080_04297 [Modestobacter sp. DSM 44400]
MTAAPEPLRWEGEDVDAAAARRAAAERDALLRGARGEAITIANEFAEVRVLRVDTRNGSRLLIESPKSGQWVALDPLEMEALTWQNTATFSAMIGNPFGPLIPDSTAGVITDGSVREGGGSETVEGGSQ